ncbi:Uma2 family endonuclease [Actinomadura scrupuli]|uniref:Uma2 family endonuclease n=1 Tax=Actinomadura scrupuli TaxID=559629 RepID=UPI003D97BC66
MALAYAMETAHTMDDEREPTLREIHESLDIPGCRVEIIGERIIVSPTPIMQHGKIVFWLGDVLRELCETNNWARLPQTTVDLLTTEERFVPDLVLCPEDKSPDGDWLLPPEHTILVVEVVSASSRNDDYKSKEESYAKNGIPMYLIVDPFLARLTLCTEPSDRGYRMVHSVDVGEKLDLPEPLGITLDTATAPIKPAEK